MAIFFAAFYAYSTWQYLPVWFDNNSLYTYQIAATPHSAKTQYNYALVLQNRQDYAGAQRHLEEALRIYPRYGSAALALGEVHRAAGNFPEAQRWYQEALALDRQLGAADPQR